MFRTRPELEKPENRSGIAFVSILFGLVVTEAALDLSTEFVKWWDGSDTGVQETRLAHLAVAMTATILSWIGYHQSQQYPPFVIKFVNIPFFQFGLDVLMVVAYYGVVAMAETSDPDPAITHSAVPEAVLVSAIFALYAAWDGLGYRLARDPAYASRYATPRPPASELGARRRVTFVFLGISALLALGVALWDPAAPATVVGVDAVLVVILVSYRLAKQAFDANVQTRDGEPPVAEAGTASGLGGQ